MGESGTSDWLPRNPASPRVRPLPSRLTRRLLVLRRRLRQSVEVGEVRSNMEAGLAQAVLWLKDGGKLISVLQGLLVGAAGGALCAWIGLPAPWIAGSMLAGVVAVLAKVRIGMPGWLATAAFIFLGMQTGTSVSWATVERAIQWPLSLAVLGLTVAVIISACMVFYIGARTWDAASALYASVPGALALVLLLASGSKADMRRVTIAQCIRLFLLVAALPVLIAWMAPAPSLGGDAKVIGGVADLALLIGLSVAAALTLQGLKVPAGLILGPMLTGAALELTGLISGAMPDFLLIPANVVLGVLIAWRFSGFSLHELLAALGDGFSGFVLALAIAAGGAAIAAELTGLPFALTLLAFAPGGLEAMTIMAFALNLDPAYVGAHQVARYLGIALLLPPIARIVLPRLRAE